MVLVLNTSSTINNVLNWSHQTSKAVAIQCTELSECVFFGLMIQLFFLLKEGWDVSVFKGYKVSLWHTAEANKDKLVKWKFRPPAATKVSWGWIALKITAIFVCTTLLCTGICPISLRISIKIHNQLSPNSNHNRKTHNNHQINKSTIKTLL